MKIAYILSTLRNTGPVNGLYNRLKYMDGHFQPIIITLSEEPKNTAIARIKELGVPIFQLGLSRIGGFLKGPAMLKELIAKEQPDIVHTHGLRPDILSAKYLAGYRRCSTMHNYPPHDYVMKYGKLRGSIMSRQQFQAIKKIEHGIACSKSIAAMFRRHGVDLKPILNGVDQERFFPITDDERTELRKKLNLPMHKRIFVSVGSMIQRKDPETVIRGFLNSEVGETGVLVMVGDGPLRESCQQIARDDARVIFTGQTNDVPQYLRAANYFISAAFSEGLPNAVLEAMATGLPVCLSDIEPHQEIFAFDDRIGVLFPPGDSDHVAQSLDQLLEQNYSEMVQYTLQVVEQHLSAKIMSENYQHFYKEIVS